MEVREIMNKNVKTLLNTSNVKDAAKAMSENKIGSVVIVDQKKKMVGLVTDTDITSMVAKGTDPAKTSVKEIMATKVYFVKPSTTIEDAAEMMKKNNVKKLPVIDGSGLVGMVTASDIVAFEPKFMEMVSTLFGLQQKGKILGG